MPNFLKPTRFLSAIVLLGLSSCTYFSDRPAESRAKNLFKDSPKEVSIVFSHNLNGETHSCGCRQFPLGGLAPVAGVMHELKSERPTLYLDTGNTFFPSTTVPGHVRDSLSFTAENLAKGLRLLDLSFFVPGAQDFAAGDDFLSKLIKENNFNVLAANTANARIKGQLNAKPWTKIESSSPQVKLYFIGLVSPDLLPAHARGHFSSTFDAFEKAYAEIVQDGFNPEDPTHRLFVLSTGGMNHDIELAEKFGNIDWIIGSHSQSFLSAPRNINGSRIVQVLSRNHYLGEIRLKLTESKAKDTYQLHEVAESKEFVLDPNPLSSFLESYLVDLRNVQLAEQERMGASFASTDKLMQTASSCIDCHAPQGEKWMNTAHSMAFLTLKQANEASNLSCIECHSAGMGDPHGFQRSQDLVVFRSQLQTHHKGEAPGEDTDEETEKLRTIRENYWETIRQEFSEVGSVRALRPEELRKHSARWLEIDSQFEVAHNFSGVQCMSCHDQQVDHPFVWNNDEGRTPQQRYQSIKNNCLSCHDADQSPEWFHRDERGVAQALNEDVFQEMYHKVACPSMQEDYEDDYDED